MYNAVLGYPLEKKHVWLFPTGTDFAEPEMLLGKYICHEGIPVIANIFLKDGKLMVTKDGKTMQLHFCGETWFQMVDEEDNLQGRMHFWVKNGKAWGVQVYTRVFQRIEE